MSAKTDIRSVAVYCGSSGKCEGRYLTGAGKVGRLLADAGIRIVYGGGAVGPMGHLADAALERGGVITGVIPRFMVEVEWAHKKVRDLRIVDTMHARKQLILEEADAVIALPGGCGTLEELLEAITWKQLGLFSGPIVILNQEGFYDPLIHMLRACADGRFMNAAHGSLWRIAAVAADILHQIEAKPLSDRDPLAAAHAR